MKALGQDYRQGRPETAFLVRPSGEVLQGIEAFLPLLSSLRGGKVLLWILQWPSQGSWRNTVIGSFPVIGIDGLVKPRR